MQIGMDNINFNIKPGDRITIKYPNSQGGNVDGDRTRTVKGVVVGIHKHFVRLDLGKYKESFCWWDVWIYRQRKE